MGSSILSLANADERFGCIHAIEGPQSDALGSQPIPGITICADLEKALAQSDVYIDFTTPKSTLVAARAALNASIAAVIGTTGLDNAAMVALDELSSQAPVVVAPNFSIGVNLLLGLAERAARATDSHFDLEVIEMHHRDKVDSPSGTALALGRALAAGRGLSFDRAQALDRCSNSTPRQADEIGMAVVRGGGIVGDHTALLIGQEERIELTHRASSRRVFASGALHAATWAVGKPPGRYSMRDVLAIAD